MFALYNRITRIISLSAFVLFALHVANLFRVSSHYEETHRLVLYFIDMYEMTMGIIPFTTAMGQSAVWIVSMGLGILIVLFTFHKFNFVAIAIIGAVVYILAWGPGFARDEGAFLIFLFAFVVMLIRKMNTHVSVAMRVAPLVAIAIVIVNLRMPLNSEFYVRRSLNQTFTLLMENVSDRMFEVFNPTYFSFQSTGFGGSGGRLGGPVTLNNRTVMDVTAPPGTYLSGAISNTYTGSAWVQTLQEGDIYTHGLPPAQFEMLETAAALIRSATFAHTRASIGTERLVHITGVNELATVLPRHFAALGVIAQHQNYYLHTYLPIETAQVSMGRQRTGTIFRPQNAWGLDFGTGANYLQFISTSPLGDMQAPGLMARDTVYSMLFLDVDRQLPMIGYVLRQAGLGVYATRVENDNWWQQATLGGQITGLGSDNLRDSFMHLDLRLINARRQGFERVHYTEINLDMPDTYVIDPPPWWRYYFTLESWESHDFEFVPLEGEELEIFNDWSDEIDHSFFRQELFDLADEMNFWNVTWYWDEYGYADFDTPGRFVPGELRTMYLYIWQENNWENAQTSEVVLPFQNAETFGVAEMQVLFNLFANSIYGEVLGYIPTEAYLMHWLDMFATDVLELYAYQVRLHFMDVPDIVPQRVYDLTHQIIAGAETDFDRVMAIRNYLQRFPYTLTPAHVPRGVCFVDHFLFEGREGYCTYFASAMAIMARIAGVPSRYVDGFALPRTAGETVTVTNRMAHAWVEVYLEGFGWLTIEATPAYLGTPPDPVPTSNVPAHILDGSWMDQAGERVGDPELMDGYIDAARAAAEAAAARAASGGGIGAIGGVAGAVANQIAVNWVLILLVVLVLVLLTLLLSRFWVVVLSLARVQKQSPDQQVIAYFGGILDIVTYYTSPLIPGETPFAYGKHKGKRFAFHSDSVFFKDLIALYYRAKYSPHQITENESALMEEAYFTMVELLRSQKRTPFVFLYLRYVKRVGVLCDKQME